LLQAVLLLLRNTKEALAQLPTWKSPLLFQLNTESGGTGVQLSLDPVGWTTTNSMVYARYQWKDLGLLPKKSDGYSVSILGSSFQRKTYISELSETFLWCLLIGANFFLETSYLRYLLEEG